MLSVKLFGCSSIPYISGQLEGGLSALSICAFCYMRNFFDVVVFLRSIVNWRRGPWYMYTLLYVKLLWCSSIPYIYGQLEGGTSAQSICALFSMLNVFGVVVFHTSMVNCSGGEFCYMWNLFCVVVFHRSIVNWRWHICPKYICIVLYVKCIWCSGIPYIYGQLEWGEFCYMWNLFCVMVFHRSIVNWRRGFGICACCYLCNFFGVAVLHRSMVNWMQYICPQYMCIVLYVKCIWCSGIT